MCDTWVALRDATATNQVIFGKNSDRPLFDCQPLLLFPRRVWPADSQIRLAYLDLPQVEITYATLGSSPYWCWGYEEGINEHSVVIGNEALPTKTFRAAVAAYRQEKAPTLGILGMDLVRLALERSKTAGQAVEMMGDLIERYGQFGSAVPTRGHIEGGYDNSFIVADPDESWVVETAGRRWVARRVSQGCTSISNEPTIRTGWDAGSRDLAAYALQNQWWPAELAERFDFARAYVDETSSRQVAHLRLMRTRQLLAEKEGQINPQWMKRIARDHYEDTFLQGPYFDAADPDFQSVCMHVSTAGFTWGNTASSCVAILPKSTDELPVFWWTPGPPCNGCYVPFFVHGQKLPEIVSRAGTFGRNIVPPAEAAEDSFSPDSYWWLFRQLMDKVKGDPIRSLPGYYAERNRIVRAEFDKLEQAFEAELPGVLAKAIKVRKTDREAAAGILDEFTADCVQLVVIALRKLLKQFE